MVAAAIAALRREGICLAEFACDRAAKYCSWSHAIAKCVARGECQGGVVFCEDPGVVCCVANKVAGLRAVAVTTVSQAARATRALGANLLAVEMPGRTYFEVRQILRTLCAAGCACPEGTADTLRELDGHAHR
jgi:ribose 5-phosphate isomerase RpiB